MDRTTAGYCQVFHTYKYLGVSENSAQLVLTRIKWRCAVRTLSLAAILEPERRLRFRINNSNLASIISVHPICFIPSMADMVKKIELIYSPCQVSNHFKKTNQTVDWEIRLPSYFKPVELFVEVTFKCRDFQTDVPFDKTFQNVLRALNLDHVPRTRANVTVAIKNCPLECMETVTMEMLHLSNARRSSGDIPETLYRFFHLTAPGRSMKKLNSRQLYQTSIVHWLLRGNLELFPFTISMLYTVAGSQQMRETVYFYMKGDVWSAQVDLDVCCHRKKSALDLSLLQRNIRLVSFLAITSFRGFMHPLPRLNRFDTFKIELDFCQICIPLVIAALRFLLNTLSHFQVFLPIDHAFSLRAVYGASDSNDVNWNSTWPVGCLYIPNNLFFNMEDYRPKLRLYVGSNSNPPQYDQSSRGLSAHDRHTKLESFSYMLPKPWSWQHLHQWMYFTVTWSFLFTEYTLC